METRVHEIADRVYRLSTFVPDVTPFGFTFNQFLIDADEPMLFHTGGRGMFPMVSAAAALGAIGAATRSCVADGGPSAGLWFAAITGGVLLLRARSHSDVARSVPLVLAGTVTLGATFVIAAVAYPLRTPYLAAASMMLAAAALCLGFITRTMTFSPIGRRSVDLLEYLALAVIVPLACWICGVYSTARGMNLL